MRDYNLKLKKFLVIIWIGSEVDMEVDYKKMEEEDVEMIKNGIEDGVWVEGDEGWCVNYIGDEVSVRVIELNN